MISIASSVSKLKPQVIVMEFLDFKIESLLNSEEYNYLKLKGYALKTKGNNSAIFIKE